MLKFKKAKVYIGTEFYNEYEVEVNENTIEYQDDSCINKFIINGDDITISRENNEFSLIIKSGEEKANYTLKELDYQLEIEINYLDKFFEEENLVIAYQLETNDKEIKIVLETSNKGE